jgi:hypothetical protein
MVNQILTAPGESGAKADPELSAMRILSKITKSLAAALLLVSRLRVEIRDFWRHFRPRLRRI